MTDLSLLRTLLFTPATKPDRFAKAAASGADGVIIDLEDAVAPDAKDGARQTALDALRAPAAGTAWLLRVNRLTTSAGLHDLAALRDSGAAPDAVMLPKVESPQEVEIIAAHLGERPLAAQIETARGLEAACAIAAHPRVAALAFGGFDCAADLGAAPAWEPLLYARGRVVQAAAAAGIVAWDSPFGDFRDEAGLAAEARRVKDLGFTGKMAIHPSQVAPLNAAFTPAPAAVEQARRIVAAFEEAAGAAIQVDGRMVDVPVYRAALRILQLSRHG